MTLVTEMKVHCNEKHCNNWLHVGFEAERIGRVLDERGWGVDIGPGNTQHFCPKHRRVKATDYKRIAESMAVHIMSMLSSMAPDEHGNHKSLSEEDAEVLWLQSDIFRKCGPVNVVFESLIKDEED